MKAQAITPDPAVRTVRVQTPSATRDGGGGYDIFIGPGTMSIAAQTRHRRVMVVADDGVPEEFRLAITMGRHIYHGQDRVASTSLTATEGTKSIQTVERLLREVLEANLDRSDAIVALGGGITCDAAGFAASVYMRAIDWIACPTTLLAMVDASVGGKTGVNLSRSDGRRGNDTSSLRKNLVGAFHQPSLVVADVGALRSLPDRELRGGLAECIKHGLLAADWGDPGLLDWTEEALPAILALDPATLTELVTRNVTVKAAVVAADERETSTAPGGGRMALNLGHTFAHALEASPTLDLKHGEAVGLGLIAACSAAEHLGLCPRSLGDRVERVLGPDGAGLPTRLARRPDNAALIAIMRDDKKSTGGRVRLILPTGNTPGRVTVVVDPPEAAIVAGLDAIRQP